MRQDQNAAVAGENKSGRWKFLLAQTEVFAHFLSGTKAAKDAANKGKRGRNKSHAAEEDEDAELVEHAEDYQAVRLTSQPTCITGGKMREYQLAGLNWMIRLFDHAYQRRHLGRRDGSRRRCRRFLCSDTCTNTAASPVRTWLSCRNLRSVTG